MPEGCMVPAPALCWREPCAGDCQGGGGRSALRCWSWAKLLGGGMSAASAAAARAPAQQAASCELARAQVVIVLGPCRHQRLQDHRQYPSCLAGHGTWQTSQSRWAQRRGQQGQCSCCGTAAPVGVAESQPIRRSISPAAESGSDAAAPDRITCGVAESSEWRLPSPAPGLLCSKDAASACAASAAPWRLPPSPLRRGNAACAPGAAAPAEDGFTYFMSCSPTPMGDRPCIALAESSMWPAARWPLP